MSDQTSIQRPFRTLGIALGIGLIAAVILTTAGVTGPGVFTIEQAVFGLGVAVLITAAVLGTVLFRIGNVLEELRSVRAENRIIRTQLSDSEEKQHVLVLEGIGEKYASRLNQVGIISVPQLVAADPVGTARAINATTQLVEEWQAMGRLVQIKGIGPQYAELLVRCGIKTVADLARTDPTALKATIDVFQANRKTAIQKSDIGQGTVNRWTQAAGQHLNAVVGIKDKEGMVRA